MKQTSIQSCNLIKDSVVAQTKNGIRYVKFTVAHNSYTFDPSKADESSKGFVQGKGQLQFCMAYYEAADIAETLKQGDRVSLRGIEQELTGRDGSPFVILKVKAIEVLNRKADKKTAASDPAAETPAAAIETPTEAAPAKPRVTRRRKKTASDPAVAA